MDGGSRSRGEYGLYRHFEETGLFKARGPLNGTPSAYPPGCRSGEVEAYSTSDKEEMGPACVSKQEAVILRRADILSRVASEMGDAILERLLAIMHSAMFDLNVFRGAMSEGGAAERWNSVKGSG